MEQREIIFGYHAALGVLQNLDRKIFSLKCTKEFYEKNKTLIEKRKIKDFEIVTRKIIDLESKNNFHQGVFIKCCKLQKFNLDSITEKRGSPKIESISIIISS